MKVPGTFTASIVTVAELNDLENVRAYASAPTGAELRDGREFVDPNTRLRWIWSDSEAAWVSSGPVNGALTSWSSSIQVDQGASTNISCSSTYAVYSRVGRDIRAKFRVVFNASGSAGSAILVTLPVAAASAAVSNITACGGSGAFITSIGFYIPLTPVFGVTSNRVQFVSSALETNAYFGVSETIGSGEILTATLEYEAAA